MSILGIDIGTTTITALTLDTQSGKTINSKTLPNDSFISPRFSFEKAQDTNKILDIVKALIKDVIGSEKIDAIGVTGQMHGILYLDKSGMPVSPLYPWQDERGNEIYKDGVSYASYLTHKTGYKAASGFGLTTHFYNTKNDLVPKTAVKITTIHDYLVSILIHSASSTHSSDAASLGFYNLSKNAFDEDALNSVGISADILPKVRASTFLAGKTSCDFLPDGIPVSVAIGDNQASFLGSVSDMNKSILVNVGTGSQISFVTASLSAPTCGEIRPLTDDKYLFVGSSLCGGRAYAALRDFFNSCADMLGADKSDMFKKMEALSEKAHTSLNPLIVNCEFCGTRENPEKRGSIDCIGINNFTPENLINGVLTGVADELKKMFDDAAGLLSFTPEKLVGSGNGLRKSAVWREIFCREFSLLLETPTHSEEAAVGACVFAGTAANIYKSIFEAQAALLK